MVSHRKYDPATGGLKSGQTTAFDPLDRTTQESTQVGTGPVKTTTFTHLGMSDQIISEEQPDPGAGGAAMTTATYTYGPGGERISQTKSPLAGGASETSYYGVNPHTDVETLTSESGNTRSTYRYTGYGENDGAGFSGKDKATATGGPEVEAYNPYRFNSKRWDPATGGYDMGFRDYSPGLNRFLTRDMYNGALSDLRLGSDPWTGNRYAFAGGNPITGIEFDGHYSIDEEGNRVSSQPQSPARAPTMVDPKLQDLVDMEYLRPGTTTARGDGRSTTALLKELETGTPTGAKGRETFHYKKVFDQASGAAAALRASQYEQFKGRAGLDPHDEAVLRNLFQESWNALTTVDSAGAVTKDLDKRGIRANMESGVRALAQNQAVSTETGSQFDVVHHREFKQTFRGNGGLGPFGRVFGVAGFALEIPTYVEVYRGLRGEHTELDEMLYPGAGTCFFNCRPPVS